MGGFGEARLDTDCPRKTSVCYITKTEAHRRSKRCSQRVKAVPLYIESIEWLGRILQKDKEDRLATTWKIVQRSAAQTFFVTTTLITLVNYPRPALIVRSTPSTVLHCSQSNTAIFPFQFSRAPNNALPCQAVPKPPKVPVAALNDRLPSFHLIYHFLYRRLHTRIPSLDQNHLQLFIRQTSIARLTSVGHGS